MTTTIQENDMQGKICLVTGATAGIGEATANYWHNEARRWLALAATQRKTICQPKMIKEKTGNPAVEYLLADLSSQKEIRALAQQFLSKYDRLDVLVNNAGATFGERQESVDGIEMTFALNHLGYFLLTNLLSDILEASAPARVINVSSSLHKFGKLNFDDIPFKNGYARSKAYWRSKLANIAFSYELAARHFSNQKVTVNAMNPGLVATNVGESAGGMAAKIKGLIDKIAGLTTEEGAQTIIYLATSPEVVGVTGRYFVKTKIDSLFKNNL